MRRRQAKKMKIPADRKYSNVLIQKLINCFMIDGKKALAERICYKALESAGTQLNKEVNSMFEKALDNLILTRNVIAKRFGGATYAVPKEINVERRAPMAIKMMIKAMRDIVSKGKTSEAALTQVLVDTHNNTGAAIDKKNEILKQVNANEAFSHLG